MRIVIFVSPPAGKQVTVTSKDFTSELAQQLAANLASGHSNCIMTMDGWVYFGKALLDTCVIQLLEQ